MIRCIPVYSHFYIVHLQGKDVIKVFTGLRRVNKSHMLFLVAENFINKVPEADILYNNKELPEFRQMVNEKDFLDSVERVSVQGKGMLLIDEVQEIHGFEEALRGLLASKGWDIYVTGSNASMFSSDISGKLSGRHVESRINSLSYLEFLDFHKLENKSDSLLKYLRYGVLPYLINLDLNDNVVFEYLRNIYATILF